MRSRPGAGQKLKTGQCESSLREQPARKKMRAGAKGSLTPGLTSSPENGGRGRRQRVEAPIRLGAPGADGPALARRAAEQEPGPARALAGQCCRLRVNVVLALHSRGLQVRTLDNTGTAVITRYRGVLKLPAIVPRVFDITAAAACRRRKITRASTHGSTDTTRWCRCTFTSIGWPDRPYSHMIHSGCVPTLYAVEMPPQRRSFPRCAQPGGGTHCVSGSRFPPCFAAAETMAPTGCCQRSDSADGSRDRDISSRWHTKSLQRWERPATRRGARAAAAIFELQLVAGARAASTQGFHPCPGDNSQSVHALHAKEANDRWGRRGRRWVL